MNLGDLDRFMDKYVSIDGEDGEGMDGWVVEIKPEEVLNGETGRWMVTDCGMGYFVTLSAFVTSQTRVIEVDPPPLDGGKPLPQECDRCRSRDAIRWVMCHYRCDHKQCSDCASRTNRERLEGIPWRDREEESHGR